MINTPENLQPISVLIPDDDNTLEVVKALRCLGQDARFTVHVLSDVHSPVARYSRYCKHLHHHSSENDNEWIKAIESIVKLWKIDVVLPVTLRGLQLISQNREVISKISTIPPIPQYEQIELAGNKWSLYQFAKQNNLPTVPSIFIGKGGEPFSGSADIDSIEYPALLKPTLQRGGFGIVKVSSPADLENAWNDGRIIKGSDYILQSYISGFDISFSVFCQSGQVRAYTLWKELLPSKKPFRVPSLVEYKEDEHAVDIGRRLVSAIGWDGVADIDLIVDKRDNTVKILEINPRFWQSLLGSLSAGVNFPLMACLIAVGAECPQTRQIHSVKYARPSSSAHMLLSRLLGRKLAEDYSLRNSAIRFILNDPLPELIYTLRRLTRRFHRASS
jgi:D-aspartate ligase